MSQDDRGRQDESRRPDSQVLYRSAQMLLTVYVNWPIFCYTSWGVPKDLHFYGLMTPNKLFYLLQLYTGWPKTERILQVNLNDFR